MKIFEYKELSLYTTFKVGGIARYIFEPESLKECEYCIKFIKKRNLPYFVLGEGSNSLVGSYYYRGAVIVTIRLDYISYNKKANQIISFAGVSNTKISLFALVNLISGFEFLYKMPGSIGGSSVMNARAFGGTMSNIVDHIIYFDKLGDLQIIYNNEIKYSYKYSIFHNLESLIVKVVFNIPFCNTQSSFKSILKKMYLNFKRRSEMKQSLYPNAGCIFKNIYHIGVSSGQIVDFLGLKGVTYKQVSIYKNHCNFIVNKGNAHSCDIIYIISQIKKNVFKILGIKLQCEIHFKGMLKKIKK